MYVSIIHESINKYTS